MTSDDTTPRNASGVSFFRNEGDGRPATLSTDAVFELLADRRRRYVLYHLVDAENPVEVDDVVARVVEWETGDLQPPRGHEDAVAAAIHHSHLPRLERAGVASYDRQTDLVRYWGSPELEVHLDETRDADLP